jgi:peptide/nickel transport system substrate-binding protein
MTTQQTRRSAIQWLSLALFVAWTVAPVLAQTTPPGGGTLRMAYTVDAVTLNPGLITQLGTTMVGSKIFSGLLEYDWDFVPRPSLAERWEIAPDGLSYTFHLRRDVTFHDGRPLTSADVKFSIESVVKPMHSRGAIGFGALEVIETPDAHTVVFRLKHPFAPFIRVFHVSDAPILPKHLYEGTDIRNNPHNLRPIGSGPFKFIEWVKGSHILLERYGNYFRKGQPYLERLVYQVIPDQATRVAALETEQVDVVPWSGIPNIEAARLKQLPHVAMTTRGYEWSSGIMWVEFNLRRSPLNDVRVRRAIAHAIDKHFIHQNIWFGIGKVASGPLSSNHKGFYPAEVPTYAYTIEQANQLLDEAGFSKGPDGVRFKLTQDMLPYGEEWVRLAEYIREQLKKIGIEVSNRSSDVPGWFNRIWTQYDFDFTSDWVGNLSDPSLGMPRMFMSTMSRPGVPYMNSHNYQNPEIDRLFSQAARESKPDKRYPLFHQIQSILASELPVLPLLEMEFTTFYRKELEGIITGPFGVHDSFDGVYWKRMKQ